jgi:hypothetical protein
MMKSLSQDDMEWPEKRPKKKKKGWRDVLVGTFPYPEKEALWVSFYENRSGSMYLPLSGL